MPQNDWKHYMVFIIQNNGDIDEDECYRGRTGWMKSKEASRVFYYQHV